MVIAVKGIEVQNADKYNLIQFWIVFTFVDLGGIGFGRVKQSAFIKTRIVFDLHFNNKCNIPMVYRLYIQNSFFEYRQIWRLPWIFKGNSLNPPLTLQIKDSIQKSDQNFFVLFAAEDLFKGDICFNISKLHSASFCLTTHYKYQKYGRYIFHTTLKT